MCYVSVVLLFINALGVRFNFPIHVFSWFFESTLLVSLKLLFLFRQKLASVYDYRTNLNMLAWFSKLFIESFISMIVRWVTCWFQFDCILTKSLNWFFFTISSISNLKSKNFCILKKQKSQLEFFMQKISFVWIIFRLIASSSGRLVDLCGARKLFVYRCRRLFSN